jgi:hypothetical protein
MLQLLSSGGEPDLPRTYLRWIWCRAVLHRGWWLVTSVYLVLDAHLSGVQLVVIGVAQAATGLVCEVPAGGAGRHHRSPLVIDRVARLDGYGHARNGPCHQLPRPCGHANAVGAFVELVQRRRCRLDHRRAGRSDSDCRGAVVLRSGAAHWGGRRIGGGGRISDRDWAVGRHVTAGLGMLVLGGYVLIRFHERRFVRAEAGRISGSWSALAGGSALVRRNRAIRTMVAATFLINGAALVGRLQARRLIELGFPATPIVWFTALGIVTVLVGAAVFRLAEGHVEDAGGLLRAFSLACAAGSAGLVMLAAAPDAAVGAVAVVVAGGVALSDQHAGDDLGKPAGVERREGDRRVISRPGGVRGRDHMRAGYRRRCACGGDGCCAADMCGAVRRRSAHRRRERTLRMDRALHVEVIDRRLRSEPRGG